MDSINHAIFLMLNVGAEPPRPLLWFAILSAKHLYYLVPLHITLVWFGGTRDMRRVALAGILAMAAALLVSGLIGLVVHVPRPNIIGLGRTLLDHRPSAAFPSNHAIVCFSWAATLAIRGRQGLALAAAGLGMLVAWSRVYLGVHFPLDMVGAAAISVVLAAVVARLTRIYGDDMLDLYDRALRRVLPVRAGRPASRRGAAARGISATGS